MIYGLPGQNLCFGDSFRITLATGAAIAVGNKIKSAAGAAAKQAWVVGINATLGYIDCVAIRGTFAVGDTFSRYDSVITGADIGTDDGAALAGGPYTILTVSTYIAGRAMMRPTHAASLVTGYDVRAVQDYDLSHVARFSIAGAGSTYLVWDRGTAPGSFVTENPTMALISGLRIVSPAYNYVANTSVLSEVKIMQADDIGVVGNLEAGATNLETLATIVNGAPTDGWGCFGQGQLCAPSFAFTASRRFIFVKFTTTGSLVFEVGNVWIGKATDTITTESWNFGQGFSLTNVDRGRYTELENGGVSRVHRTPYRRYEFQVRFNRKSWHTWLDAVEGRAVSWIDDPQHPWAICLDPSNLARLVTGQHELSGLFRVDGSPSAKDSGAWDNSGVYFMPDIPISLREIR